MSVGIAYYPDADGREIELHKSDTHLQWRYVGDGSHMYKYDGKVIQATGGVWKS